MLFNVAVVFAALSPLILGFEIGKRVPPPPALDWTLALDSRTAAVAQRIHQHKIIFIGGSNIRFGVDAPRMTRDLGVPVINYGLHAGLGADVIAGRALECVSPGDIVVYSPELSHFHRNASNDRNDDLRLEFLTAHPNAIQQTPEVFFTTRWWRARYRSSRIRTLLEANATYRLQRAFGTVPSNGVVDRFFGPRVARAFGIKAPPQAPAPAGQRAAADGSEPRNGKTPYTLDAIDADGNILFPRPGSLSYASWQLSNPDEHNPAAMDPIDSRGGTAFSLLKDACAARNCTLCVMPPLRLSVPQFDQPALLKMEQTFIDYATRNGAIELLQPGENVLPREYGYDTDYHLNDVGVKIMEPRLVAALRSVENYIRYVRATYSGAK